MQKKMIALGVWGTILRYSEDWSGWRGSTQKLAGNNIPSYLNLSVLSRRLLEEKPDRRVLDIQM